MKITETGIKDLVVVEPQIFEDPRGYFYESYNRNKLLKNNITDNFIQDNQSKSSFGVIRGLHYQLNPYAQTKLIRVLEGVILDVVIDIRKGSPTFGEVFCIELSADNKLQLYIPKGFAHGFSVIGKTAIVFYKCDERYSPDHERGIIFNDPDLNIDWKIKEEQQIISQKDLQHPFLKNADMNFQY